MAGYSFRFSKNICLMGIFAVSKEDGFSSASVSCCLPPLWRKVLIEANTATHVTGRLQFLPEIFSCWRAHLLLTLIPHSHVLRTCLKVTAPAAREKEQRNACVGDHANMSWWISFTGLGPCIWNPPRVSLDSSRKSHSTQVIVPEELPTTPPCKRFPRLLVTMTLRMFSKAFF